MKIRLQVIFQNEYQAEKWAWLFKTILRGKSVCCNGYCNAWELP